MIKPFSPVEQDFIWVGEYSNGENLSEYDFTTQQPNKFYSLERERLERFGLVGHGMHLFLEVFGGNFKLKGQQYQFLYKEGEELYHLTGQATSYNDVITYKDAEAFAVPSATKEGRFVSRITQFTFGYKIKLTIKEVNFFFKVLCSIPTQGSAYLTFHLVSDKKLGGQFIIKRNGHIADQFEAPLDPEVGGQLRWLVK